MNIHIYNYARSFIVSYWNDESEWEDACPYSTIDAAVEAAKNEIDVRKQALAAHIYDAETGELYVTCTSDDMVQSEEDLSEWDDVDESNYDPYLGCDVYETEPMCDMW